MRIADHIEKAEPANADSTVYKARQTDGSFTAVQVFPFRLGEEQLIYFNEQVELLGEAYIEFRAAIPRILSHGFTKTGSFPFIQTEWINGFTLAALNKKENAFTIDSIINVAEEVSRAMAYCHKLGVVHGDISTNNIIWEEKQKRYVVTGFRFGLGTSGVYPRSRSVAVITPGQKNYLRSKQEDVKDIGKLLWQLLTGKMNGYDEGVEGLYQQNHSAEWTEGSKEKAEKIPAWFVTCIQKALGIDKEKNFENAVQLYGYILSHHKIPFQKKDWYRSKPQSFSVERKRTSKKFRFARKKVQPGLKLPVSLQKKIKKLRFVFDRNIGAGLIVAILLLGFSIYAQKKEQRSKTDVAETGTSHVAKTSPSTTDTNKKENIAVKKANFDTLQKQPEIKTTPAKEKTVVVPVIDSTPSTQTDSVASKDLGSYKVRSKAYFHNAPDETTKRNAFIVHWNNAVLHPLKEEGDFVYIVFTNHLGQTSRGWLRKQDLIRQ